MSDDCVQVSPTDWTCLSAAYQISPSNSSKSCSASSCSSSCSSTISSVSHGNSDSNTIIRPSAASAGYLAFVAEQRPLVVAAESSQSVSLRQMQQLLTARWLRLSNEEKQVRLLCCVEAFALLIQLLLLLFVVLGLRTTCCSVQFSASAARAAQRSAAAC